MELEGKIWKDGKFWLAEVSSLDLMTQGKTYKDAHTMICDAVSEMLISYFPKAAKQGLEVTVHEYSKGLIGVSVSDSRTLFALSLRRQREVSGTTIREASERLGSKSPNAYAQYEKGKTRISLDQYDKLLQAANPEQHCLLRVF